MMARLYLVFIVLIMCLQEVFGGVDIDSGVDFRCTKNCPVLQGLCNEYDMECNCIPVQCEDKSAPEVIGGAGKGLK